MSLLFCLLASAKVLLSGPIDRLRHGTIKNFVVAVVYSPLEYIHVEQVENLRKLGIQAVCLDPSFDDETSDFSVFS
jgi:hypothetical protein